MEWLSLPEVVWSMYSKCLLNVKGYTNAAFIVEKQAFLRENPGLRPNRPQK